MLRMLRTTGLSLLIFLLPLALSVPALAQTNLGTTPTGGTQLPVTGNPEASKNTGQTLVNPLKGITSLPELLKAVLDAVIYLGSIVLTLAIIWVGFLFVAARGNPEKIKEARSALMWTLIGGLILLGANAISIAIQSTVSSLQS